MLAQKSHTKELTEKTQMQEQQHNYERPQHNRTTTKVKQRKHNPNRSVRPRMLTMKQEELLTAVSLTSQSVMLVYLRCYGKHAWSAKKEERTFTATPQIDEHQIIMLVFACHFRCCVSVVLLLHLCSSVNSLVWIVSAAVQMCPGPPAQLMFSDPL